MCKIQNKTLVSVYLDSGTLETLFLADIQVGTKTVLVSGTVLTLQAIDKLKTFKFTLFCRKYIRVSWCSTSHGTLETSF